MNKTLKKIHTFHWLECRLINRENGIFIEHLEEDNFEYIQDFLELHDHPFKTTAIYYQAFPGESCIEFFDTLKHEIANKFEASLLNSTASLKTIVEKAELKMVIIDHCYLHPDDTLGQIIDTLSQLNIALILVGSKPKMYAAQVFKQPTVQSWNTVNFTPDHEHFPRIDLV